MENRLVSRCGVNTLIESYYNVCFQDIHKKTDGDFEITLKTPGMEKLMTEYAAFKNGYLDDPVPYMKGG